MKIRMHLGHNEREMDKLKNNVNFCRVTII